MKTLTCTGLVALTLSAAAFSTPALAAPMLRTHVAVENAIVTVGDLFADAGINAERALFRAPAPGTAGTVSINAVRHAAKRIGITEFDTPPVDSIHVERTGVAVSLEMVENLVKADLDQRGLLMQGATAKITLDNSLPAIQAATTSEPVRLTGLDFRPGPGTFYAKLQIAGYREPMELRGRIDFLVEAPHLTTSLASGTVLSPDDIEMRPVQFQYAQNGGLATLDQLVGKELRRPAREGMMIRPSDVIEPEVIKRSDLVTLYYAHGPLRLTVKGQALNAAAAGEAVAVLNLVSKKIVHGLARDPGSVELVMPRARSGLES